MLEAKLVFKVWAKDHIEELSSQQAAFDIHLPSETQWEKRRGAPMGGITHRGNNPHPEKANYDATGIGATSAAGCFAGGASPYGAEDLGGNVYEWCLTKWEDSYSQYRGDDTLEGDAARVLRGGAFYGNERSVRCAYRINDFPYARYDFIGFRVVVSPFFSTPDSENSEL